MSAGRGATAGGEGQLRGAQRRDRGREGAMPIARLIDPFRPAGGPPPRRLLPFLGWCLSGAWAGLIAAALLSAAAGVLDVIMAAFLGRVIDAAVGSAPASVFADNWPLFLAFALFLLVAKPLVFGASVWSNAVLMQPAVLPLVLSRLHRWTLGQPVSFFDNDFAGRIAQKQMQTARAVTDVATEVINTVVFALASVAGSVVFLSAIDVRVAAALAVWLAAYLGLIGWFLPRVRAKSAARAAARAMITGVVVDTVTNIKTVKLFAHAEHEDRAAIDAMEAYRRRTIDYGVLSVGFRTALMVLAGILPILLIGGTILLWRDGGATAGDIAAAGALSIRISQMTGWVSFALMGIYTNVGEVEDGMRTLSAAPTLTDAPGAAELGRVRGAIAFEGVRFAYGRARGGIEGVTLRIAPGEKVGIVGASGAGKSTLVALLLRLYDPEAGRVTIDGIDVRSVTQESLRRQIAMVTQETALFNRSARENILYGRPDATEAELVAAARHAEADGFIRGLVDHAGRRGYDAHLGERGVKLSGGQRQRIALARAFLKDAPILVLDEATSALDSEAEAAIQTALTRIMRGKTVLAIAHRLSTLSAMDRIVVMDAGRIVEEGTHAALIARGGLYARYWARQSGGFLGTESAPAAAE
jgi:ATP-binding cassette subfamily B protein